MLKRYHHRLFLMVVSICLLPMAVWAGQGTQKYSTLNDEDITFSEEAPEFYKVKLNKLISVDFNDITLEKALQTIAEKSNLSLTYRGDFLVPITVNLTNNQLTVTQTLNKVLKGTGLDYLVSRDGHLIIKHKTESKTTTFAQQDTIRGVVRDSRSKNPLPGVNVIVQGTNIGTATDSDGQYSLAVPDQADTLMFSYIGYAVTKVAIDGRNTINVNLQPETIAGREVVVVGYGEQERRSMSSSVSQIKTERIEQQQTSDIRQVLQGTSPGVTVVDRGGPPGSKNYNINIRGETTIGNNYPLILVNGIEQDLSDIDPDNIASMSVLKGPSAAAIYGSRAAKGVILVETKNPQEGRLNVQYNTYYGFERITNKAKPLGLKETLELEKTLFENAGINPPPRVQNMQEYLNAPNRYEYPMPNPYMNALFRIAPVNQHSLTFSGGTQNIQSRLSLNYNNRGGVIPKFNSKRYSVRFDNNFDVTDDIRVSTRLTYRHKQVRQPFNVRGVPSLMFNIWHWSQYTPIQYPDGRFGLGDRNANPLMEAKLSGWQNNRTDYAVANIKAEVDLLDNLTYTTQFGGHVNLNTNKQFRNQFQIREWFDGPVGYDTGFNHSSDFSSRADHWTWRNLLDYRVNLGSHNITALAGYEETRDNFAFRSAYREQFYNNEIYALNGGSQENWSNAGNITEERLRSVFGRVRYNYDNRYIIEGNARYDGSSRFFGANNQFGFFPSFSAAWRVSEESFFQNLTDAVNELKLRISWGQAGNNTVALYQFFPSLTQTTYTFGGELATGYYKPRTANPDLTWETTTQQNIGLDIELWEGALGATFDYYSKETDGILLQLPIPGTVGLNPAPQNAGVVENKGWEFSLSHQNEVSQDLSYSIEANVSDNDNNVADLAQAGPFINVPRNNMILKEGEPMNSWWLWKTDGYFESREEINNTPTFKSKSNTHPGDLKYVDVNGDGNINPDDRTIVGNEFPQYQFGLTGNVNYKNFDFHVFIQGVGKHDIFQQGTNHLGGVFAGYIIELAGDYWTPDNKDARFPRPEKFTNKNIIPSTHWLVDGSYIRLKNIQLGYTLPGDISEKVGIDNFRVYLSSSNLLTVSKVLKWGIDPERPESEADYPQTIRYTMGLNLEF